MCCSIHRPLLLCTSLGVFYTPIQYPRYIVASQQTVISLLNPRLLGLPLHPPPPPRGIPTHKTPFVLGISAAPVSLVAIFSANAVALNALSALWWSLNPFKQSTCSVIPAFWAKLSRTCGIISQLSSPIFSRLSPRSICAPGRPDMSTTARESASSSGA